MIATAFFTGVVVNDLDLIVREDEGRTLSILLKVQKPNRTPKFFYIEAYNAEALQFKQEVSRGDFVAITAEPYSSLKEDVIKNKEQYVQGYKVAFFEVLKRGDMK